MKRKVYFLVLLFLVAAGYASAQDSKSFYDYQLKDINGKTYKMSDLKGKKVLIVNTATQCSLSPQFSGLEQLYKDNSDKLVVIAVPSNDFGDKEPGSDNEIKNYVEKHYDVTFPVMAKTSVKGEDENPLYKWLTEKKLNGVMDTKVAWNYQKYMIDENGKLVGVVDPKESPGSDKIMEWLKK
ncbi:MAG TPA: glutathione peroxidase [Bacteroidales bacterium]|nr:glutathione peroxidase [Bacteroidales bacterium]